MNHSAVYLKSSNQRWLSSDSDNESWPKDLREPREEVYRKQTPKKSQKVEHVDAKNQMTGKNTSSLETLIQITVETCTLDQGNNLQVRNQEEINTFWISVSGYEYASTNLVYRFFGDIGQIVGKYFTETNLMYLKYFSMLDCEIALSYNGQKIGYGGDISVKVKPENPVTQCATIEALEESLVGDVKMTTEANSTSTTVTIDGEENRDRKVLTLNSHRLEIGQAKNFQTIRKKVSIMQWFKEKLSYIFYFY